MGSLVPRSSPSSSRRRPDRKPDESQPWRGPRSRPRRADTQSSSTHSFSVRCRLSAWAVLAGLSPFGKKIGKRVASSQLTLYDDGSADSIARKRFDAEGVPTRRNLLVNKGILKTYLHNTSTAKKFKTKTTGNAGLVAPDSHAVFVKPGDRSRDEIFSEVKDGLWLTNTWYTRYQSYVTGDLSTIPRDGIFHIRNGDVVEAWKDIRVTDNLLHLMKNIVALSDEAEQMMWWGEVSVPNFVPYALIKDVGITTSNQ